MNINEKEFNDFFKNQMCKPEGDVQFGIWAVFAAFIVFCGTIKQILSPDHSLE